MLFQMQYDMITAMDLETKYRKFFCLISGCENVKRTLSLCANAKSKHRCFKLQTTSR